MRKIELKGSYTVEAAFIIPILLFTMVSGMKIGLSLYQEILMEKEQQKVEELWAVEDFYKYQWIGEVTDD